MSDDILSFAVERGEVLRPLLRDALSPDDVTKIRYARDHNVSWGTIAAYFKKDRGWTYDAESYRRYMDKIGS